jgi:hypothetical protein
MLPTIPQKVINYCPNWARYYRTVTQVALYIRGII